MDSPRRRFGSWRRACGRPLHQLCGTAGSLDALLLGVLARASRGELVPTEAELARREGRSYEPASALLERIRQARQEQPQRRAMTKRLGAGNRRGRGQEQPRLLG
jgi:hypothetical protein